MRQKPAINLLVGYKVNRLTVIGNEPSKNGHRMIKCMCDCGNTTIIRASALISGNTLSCGCLNSELIKNLSLSRKIYTEKELHVYNIYNQMKARCYRKTDHKYPTYGGRGIKICDRWLGKFGFKNFLQDMGDRPSKQHSIDRIDNNGDYAPNNCRWATPEQQANNKRNNVYIYLEGVRISQAQMAKIFNTCPHNISNRIKKGMTGEQIFQEYTSKLIC